MRKSTGSSWLPKSGGTWVKRKETDGAWISRDAVRGWIVRGSSDGPAMSDSTRDAKAVMRAAAAALADKTGKVSSGEVAGKITLPNGHQISTVRRDVLDSALGRAAKRDK